MRTVIIDDEPHSADLLRHLVLKHCPELTVTGVYTSSEKAFEALSGLPAPELLLLDIEMPRMNGFELLSRLTPFSFAVIFTTAYDKYAVRAFKFSALDYLMKPIDTQELKDAVRRAVTHETVTQEQLDLHQQVRESVTAPSRIALSTMEGMTFVDVRDIIHCESQSAYCNVFLTGDRKVLLSRHLKEVSEILEPCGFIRVHHSHLINPQHIRQYLRGEGGEIILANGQNIPVSRSKKQEFLDKIVKM